MTQTTGVIGRTGSGVPGIGVNERIDLCRGIFAYLLAIALGRELARLTTTLRRCILGRMRMAGEGIS